jgi:heme oxygenase
MVLEKIREKTKEYHDQFTGWARDILSGTITLEEYKKVLKIMYGFHYPHEQRLLAFDLWDGADQKLDLKTRIKTDLLIEDLKAIGATEEEIENIEICTDFPPAENLGQILGSMYVIEGATIGGQIMSKKLTELFDLKESGALFFNSYGDRIMPMFKVFCDVLNTTGAEKDIEETIVTSSVETYYAFNNWLSNLTK